MHFNHDHKDCPDCVNLESALRDAKVGLEKIRGMALHKVIDNQMKTPPIFYDWKDCARDTLKKIDEVLK